MARKVGNYTDERKAPSYRRIAEYFWKPLMKLKPKNTTNMAWLSGIFNVESREITTWKALETFELPGTFKVAANKTVPGVGNRKVKKGDQLWVRTDHHYIDLVEVEIVNEREDKEYLSNTPRWFVMTRKDWRGVVGKVEQL